MSANINVENGNAAFAYAGERPWHGLGTQVAGLMKTDEALKVARLDWGVEKRPLFFTKENITTEGVSLEYVKAPSAYAVVRSDNENSIGIVGERYTPMNNNVAFAPFDDILGLSQAQIETAGALGAGERVFMMARLPEVTEIVKGDILEKFLLVATSHDGSTPTQITFTNVRVVCQNTLTMAVNRSSNIYKVRHTATQEARLKIAADAIKKAHTHWADVVEACKFLASVSADRKIVENFVKEMFPLTGEKEISTRLQNTRDSFLTLVESGKGTELNGVKGTFWGLFNAYTEWLDHHRATRGDTTNNWESSVFGSGVNLRQKAFDLVLDTAKAA